MGPVFVDTWAWIALALKRDQHHESAKTQHQLFIGEGRPYVTSDFVVGELVTQLYRLLPAGQAEAFVKALLAACDAAHYKLVHVSPEQFQRAWQLRRQFDDKPGISFVDFLSMIVMQDLNLKDVFTGDADFQHVNLGFRLYPL